MKYLYKILLVVLCVSFLFSCKKNENNKMTEVGNAEKTICGEKFVEYNEGLSGTKIYILRNQGEGQILSIVLKTNNEKILIFDGGREEDSEFLYNIIKNFGGVVEAWFLTHAHDDHIGAIYNIMKNYNDIHIKNIYYQFPKFDYLYNLVGQDAGAVILVENQFAEYKIKKEKANFVVNIYNSVKKKNVVRVDNIDVEVMNDMYLIDNDTINNSSIVYKVKIKNNDNVLKSMIVLGDLSYEGGEKILVERGNDLKSDICVLAHHGQGGVWKEVYEKINPKSCIWPTTKTIYENKDKKYKIDLTKEWLNEIGVEKNYIAMDNSIILK